MVDKLVECDEIVEETSLVKINSKKYKHNSCILYIVLFSIFSTINIGTATYFVYYRYMNCNKKNVLNVILSIMQKIINQIKCE